MIRIVYRQSEVLWRIPGALFLVTGGRCSGKPLAKPACGPLGDPVWGHFSTDPLWRNAGLFAILAP